MFWAWFWFVGFAVMTLLWLRQCARTEQNRLLAEEAESIRKKQREQYQMELNAAILKADRVNSIHVLGVEIEPADDASDIEEKKEQAIEDYLREKGYLPEVIN